MRAIVTRPAADAAAWQRRLQEAGIDAAVLPLLVIGAPAEPARVTAEWRRLAERRLVVFVSPAAVRGFFAARPLDAPGWPDRVLAAAPGPGTADALRAAGVAADALVEPAAGADKFDSEALWERLRGRDWAQAKVLVVRGDGGREWLAERLVAAGASVDHVAAYARRPPVWDAAAEALLAGALADPEGTVWLLSSGDAVGHLRARVGGEALRAARAIASHPRIAARARDAGFAEVREASPRLDAIIACIQSMRP